MEDKDLDKLMNENWSRMLSILDQKMPQKKGKKRPVYFWWISAAIFMSIFMIIGMPDYKTMKLPKKELVYNKQKSKKAMVSEISAKNAFLDKKHNISASGRIYRHKENKFRTEVSLTKVYINKRKNAFRNKQLNEHNPLFNGKKIPDSYLELSMNHQMDAVDSQNTNESRIFSYPIVKLPSIQSNNILSDNYKIPNLNTTPIKSDPIKLNMGVEISALTHDYTHTMSYSAGLFVVFPIQSNWQISSGIRWSRYNYSSPFYSRKDIIVAGSNKELMDAKPTNYMLNVEEHQIDPLRREILNGITKHLDYAEFSVGFIYKLNSRINLTGGTLVGLHIRSKYRQDADTDILLNNYNEAALTQEKINAIGRLHTNYIWRMSAGLDYFLTKRIAFTGKADLFINQINNRHFDEINYNPNTLVPSSISNSVLENHNKDKRVGIEFGLKYYLM